MAGTRVVNISESLAQDIRENLTVLARIDGVDGLLYARQVAFYRDVAALLGCGGDVERLIVAVTTELQPSRPADGSQDGIAV